MMMELKDDVRIACRIDVVLQRGISTTGIPLPIDPRVIEQIADVQHVARLRWLRIIN